MSKICEFWKEKKERKLIHGWKLTNGSKNWLNISWIQDRWTIFAYSIIGGVKGVIFWVPANLFKGS